MANDYLVHIVAVDENNGIGYKDKLLFRIKDDLKNFRKLTLHGIVIAGTKTINTLPVLKERTVVQLTRTPDKYRPNEKVSEVISNIKGYLRGKHDKTIKPNFIIGGGEIYKETLQDVSIIVLTRIHAKAQKCDTYYPDVLTERIPTWTTSSKVMYDEETGIAFSFHIYAYNKDHLKHFLKFKHQRDKDEKLKTAKTTLGSKN